MTKDDAVEAEKLAAKLNIIPIAFFALWLGPMMMFWMQALGPLQPFDAPSPIYDPWPWLVCSLLMGSLVLFIPPRWYATQPCEASGRIYRYLGVAAFRHLVTNGDLINRAVARRHPNYRVFKYSDLRSALGQHCDRSERAHLVAFGAGAVTSIYAFQIGWTGWAGWLTFSNLASNLFPALVQRFTRARLTALANRTTSGARQIRES